MILPDTNLIVYACTHADHGRAARILAIEADSRAGASATR